MGGGGGTSCSHYFDPNYFKFPKKYVIDNKAILNYKVCLYFEAQVQTCSPVASSPTFT